MFRISCLFLLCSLLSPFLSPYSLYIILAFCTSRLQDTCSVVSDYDCPCADVNTSVEDLLGLSSSLRDSEYFKDLEGGNLASQSSASPESNTLTAGLQVSPNNVTPAIDQPARTSLTAHSSPLPYSKHPAEEPHHNFLVTQLSPKLAPGCIIDRSDSLGSAAGLSWRVNLNGLLKTIETPKERTGSEEVKEPPTMDFDGEPDMDSVPILVRSMSTSRRHSWGSPVSPINLGRR